MIRIIVDTVDEATMVRRVLATKAKTEMCTHCSAEDIPNCFKCVADYCEGTVELYKREIVETPIPIVL